MVSRTISFFFLSFLILSITSITLTRAYVNSIPATEETYLISSNNAVNPNPTHLYVGSAEDGSTGEINEYSTILKFDFQSSLAGNSILLTNATLRMKIWTSVPTNQLGLNICLIGNDWTRKFSV